MYILGTAGHVDHGKSSLIAALTGTHPDRLKEEKVREMTIELGFASLRLPNDEEVGIIDVPGHRSFIDNMLAGIGGIDAVLLVVAADEGVSAQTREHLAILDLLEIKRGIIVLTKTDLISEPEWLDLLEMDLRELVRGTSLAEAPVVPVSSRTGAGLPELLETIQNILVGTPGRTDLGKPRLPVDRVFTLTGFGTVVTGTLLDGSFRLGDEIVCLPGGKTGRIRGLQNHNRKLQKIEPGFRAAINLTNLNLQDVSRGDVIAKPGDYQPTQLLDCQLSLLKDSLYSIRHNMQVKLYIAASETTAFLRLLGTKVLAPGESAFIQLRTDHPVVASKGDRFILRLPSPSETLGGGVVLDPDPKKLYKRFDQVILDKLDKLFSGNESELVQQILEFNHFTDYQTLAKKSALPQEILDRVLNESMAQKTVLLIKQMDNKSRSVYINANNWNVIKEKISHILKDYHHNHPLKAGMPREELKRLIDLNQENYDLSLDRLSFDGSLVQKGTLVWAAGHEVKLTSEQEEKVAPVLAEFETNPFSPPDKNQIVLEIGQDLIEGLISSGRLVPVSDLILFTPDTLQTMQDWVKETITQNGEVSLSQFRDHFKTSRKYAASALEYFDEIGFTYRKGDVRALR